MPDGSAHSLAPDSVDLASANTLNPLAEEHA